MLRRGSGRRLAVIGGGGRSPVRRRRRKNQIELGDAGAVVTIEGDIAADEVAPELARGDHDGEGAGGRVDDQIAGFSEGGDEAPDQADRLYVGVELAVDLLWPAVRNPVVTPGTGADRGLLQNQEIIAAPAHPFCPCRGAEHPRQ